MKRIINDWVPETKSLIEDLIAAGVSLVSGDNGEERFKFDGDLPKFLDSLLACDEARLYVKVPGSANTKWILLVLGNEPGVLSADYCVDPTLERVSDAHYEKWSRRPQPTKEVEA